MCFPEKKLKSMKISTLVHDLMDHVSLMPYVNGKSPVYVHVGCKTDYYFVLQSKSNLYIFSL